jgi:hypothetical protein
MRIRSLPSIAFASARLFLAFAVLALVAGVDAAGSALSNHHSLNTFPSAASPSSQPLALHFTACNLPQPIFIASFGRHCAAVLNSPAFPLQPPLLLFYHLCFRLHLMQCTPSAMHRADAHSCYNNLRAQILATQRRAALQHGVFPPRLHLCHARASVSSSACGLLAHLILFPLYPSYFLAYLPYFIADNIAFFRKYRVQPSATADGQDAHGAAAQVLQPAAKILRIFILASFGARDDSFGLFFLCSGTVSLAS